mmetsp:Transcript_34728/g.103507  ORF Transcript_34728/g.103507 Transcript_34728/m.103507 type:complete len:159 (-) Transcript_34728:612-1088(-)
MAGALLIPFALPAGSVLPARAVLLPVRCHRVAPVVMDSSDDESEAERRARYEALGREEVVRQSGLDAGADDGGLMAEFNKRVESEGGATAFKAKIAVSDAKSTVTSTAAGAKRAGEEAVDAVSSLGDRLTEQQRKIATIVFGLIGFQIFIQILSSALR